MLPDCTWECMCQTLCVHLLSAKHFLVPDSAVLEISPSWASKRLSLAPHSFPRLFLSLSVCWHIFRLSRHTSNLWLLTAQKLPDVMAAETECEKVCVCERERNCVYGWWWGAERQTERQKKLCVWKLWWKLSEWCYGWDDVYIYSISDTVH